MMIGVILLIYQGFGLALPDGRQFPVVYQNLTAAKGLQRRPEHNGGGIAISTD
jgi:hypothetical protein